MADTSDSLGDMIRYLLCGIAMGAADVVPGVSGGTIAFISGIYQKLLDAIRSFNLTFLRALFSGRFRAALAGIPWTFLVPLLAGIGCSIFSLSRLVLHLLATCPVVIWSFFFGLILASIALLGLNIRNEMRRDERFRVASPVAALSGICFAWWLSGAQAVSMGHSLPLMFLMGFVAICAMILPGISGAFILVLLGQYQYILTAVATLRWSVLFVFAVGCACGLLSFARALNLCLARFPAPTLALLTGIMAGSLRTVWPWKNGAFPAPPPAMDMSLLVAAACCAVGALLPLTLHTLSGRLIRNARASSAR